MSSRNCSCLYCCGHVWVCSLTTWIIAMLHRSRDGNQFARAMSGLWHPTCPHTRTAHSDLSGPPAPCVSFEITQAFNLYLIIPAILMKVKGIWNKIYPESKFEWGSKFTKLSAPARCYKKASILHCNSVTYWLTELQVFCSQVPYHQCMVRVRMKSQDPILIECSSACCFISDRPSLYLDSNDWKLSRKSMKFELSSR